MQFGLVRGDSEYKLAPCSANAGPAKSPLGLFVYAGRPFALKGPFIGRFGVFCGALTPPLSELNGNAELRKTESAIFRW